MKVFNAKFLYLTVELIGIMEFRNRALKEIKKKKRKEKKNKERNIRSRNLRTLFEFTNI